MSSTKRPPDRMWGVFSLHVSRLTFHVSRLEAILWVPAIRLVGDLAKMAGYPVGLLWRWRHRAQDEIHWRKHLLSNSGPASAGPSRPAF
ncbi:MAG TPA: hypothetical protein EYP49_16585 [Anaerolineae bacterium]|nr:hypothetical protein [Anaerolineae bacterium]